MTKWILLYSFLSFVCLCVYCFERKSRYHRERWSLNVLHKKYPALARKIRREGWDMDSFFNFPRFRRFRPKRLQMVEDEFADYIWEDGFIPTLMPELFEKEIRPFLGDDYEVGTVIPEGLDDSEPYTFPSYAKLIGNTTVAAGREAKLECIIDNLGPHRVAWLRLETKTILTIHRHVISRNYRISLSNTDQRDWVLHITDVKEEDAGGYMCQVNTVPMLSQIGYLNVVVKPDFIDTESSSDVIAREGTDVSMTCKAKGKPQPTLTWRREDYLPVAIGNWQNNRYVKVSHIVAEDKVPSKNNTLHEGDTLFIKKVSRLHMGAYLCIASNGVPPAVSRRITLQVNFPPMIWIPNQLVGAPLGSSQTLECHTEAYPESINYWIRDEGSVLNNNSWYTVTEVKSSYKVHMLLTLKKIRHADYGMYSCFARNSLGMTEGIIKIYQIHVPHPFKEPSSAKIQSVDERSATGPTSIFDDEDYFEVDTEPTSEISSISVHKPVRGESTSRGSSQKYKCLFTFITISLSFFLNQWITVFVT